MNKFISVLFSEEMVEILKSILPFIMTMIGTLLVQYIINNKWPHIFSKKDPHRLEIIKVKCPKGSKIESKIPKLYKKTRKIFLEFTFEEIDVSYKIIDSYDFGKNISKPVDFLMISNRSGRTHIIDGFLFANGRGCNVSDISDSDYEFILEGEALIICYYKENAPEKLNITGADFFNEYNLSNHYGELMPQVKKKKCNKNIKKM